MSSRLKRKLGDLGVDTSSRAANESFCLIGTPLPPLEKSKDTGEFVPLWKQDVRDEKGRRRLHGAFTGGFSAGYFNTVGSKEGWAPSTFVSSRSDRAKQKAARPEDFMDEEDLQELKDSRNIIDTTDEMDLTGASKGVDEPEKDSIASVLEASLLPPSSDSVGARILKKMGWRLGQGIGPRISLRKRKMQDLQLSYGDRVSGDLANVPEYDEEASKHTYAPRDTPILLVERKDNSHGLGYDPGMSLQESVGGKGKSGEPKGPRLAAGFGLGALNDADEDDLDVYEGNLTNGGRHIAYDISERDDGDTVTIGGRSERSKKQQARPASSVAQLRDGRPVLDGFILSDRPVADDRWFPMPDIPKNWTPDPRRVWDKYNNKENAPPRTESHNVPRGWNSNITADERGAILGETPLPSAPRSVFEYMSQKDRDRLQNISTNKHSQPGSSTLGSTTFPPTTLPSETIKVPHTEPHIAQAALRGFQPFAADPAKQSRYNIYLQSQVGGDDAGPPLRLLPGQHIDGFNKEMEDYAKAALLFKPMSAAMAGRFTSAAVVEQGPKIHEGLHTPSHEEAVKEEGDEGKQEVEDMSPKAHAARMGMYGPMTRETKPWQPARLLCKRFGVRDPNPEPEVVPPPASGSNWQQSEFPMEASGGAGSGSGAVVGGDGSTLKRKKDISNVGLGEDEDQGRDILTYERPTMDIFKAIFASDDEDSGDEKEKDDEEEEKKKEPSPPIATAIAAKPEPALAASPVPPPPAPTQPIETGPVDLNTFKPTFIPREGKAKKDKDTEKEKQGEKEKSGDKDKERKKRKRDKEKRAVLSFAVDEEGREELAIKPSKDRPTKKRKQSRKEKKKDVDGAEEGDDESMWVEKPTAEAVKDLILPAPSLPLEDDDVLGSGGPLRGRKRAVDFL